MNISFFFPETKDVGTPEFGFYVLEIDIFKIVRNSLKTNNTYDKSLKKYFARRS